MLWSDNMQIPVGAPHAYTAQKLMDFVYEPEIQRQIAAYVNYVTPVKGAQEELQEDRSGARREPATSSRPTRTSSARTSSASWTRTRTAS